LSCHGYAILLITGENNRRHNQTHGSRWIKYFFVVLRRIILENHGLQLLIRSRFVRKTSHFTFHGKNRPFMNHRNTLYHPRHQHADTTLLTPMLFYKSEFIYLGLEWIMIARQFADMFEIYMYRATIYRFLNNWFEYEIMPTENVSLTSCLMVFLLKPSLAGRLF